MIPNTTPLMIPNTTPKAQVEEYIMELGGTEPELYLSYLPCPPLRLKPLTPM